MSSVSASSCGSPSIDTSRFMSRYHHPKNVAASMGNNLYARAAIATPYSKARGLYRQKQVDEEIERIRSCKRPSSSKITVTIGPANVLRMYHHHHHCLDIQLTSRRGKGRVVWFWEGWETATDERVMKGAIAALESSWTGEVEGNGEKTIPGISGTSNTYNADANAQVVGHEAMS
mmetsp:Transcript_3622/g.9233  ORF Transcript_3622/g.9233 Transcript_3622/m.9233 type:complete len:175 (+) Transcript_3622:95-619(+)